MKKALLTVQDVKNFIFEAILEKTQDRVLTRNELKKHFNITEWNVDCYLEKGLPWFGKPHRKKFNLNEVKKWFVANNIIFREYD